MDLILFCWSIYYYLTCGAGGYLLQVIQKTPQTPHSILFVIIAQVPSKWWQSGVLSPSNS